MSSHEASIRWRRTTADFAYERFNRDHTVTYPGGATLAASAAPSYHGDAARVNPEEAFVGALASCHMLTFLAVAARARWTVEAYEDDAQGFLEKNAAGRLAVTRVVLRPRVSFGGDRRPDAAQLAALHEQAHRGCFIANSVTTQVSIEPRDAPTA